MTLITTMCHFMHIIHDSNVRFHLGFYNNNFSCIRRKKYNNKYKKTLISKDLAHSDTINDFKTAPTIRRVAFFPKADVRPCPASALIPPVDL